MQLVFKPAAIGCSEQMQFGVQINAFSHASLVAVAGVLAGLPAEGGTGSGVSPEKSV